MALLFLIAAPLAATLITLAAKKNLRAIEALAMLAAVIEACSAAWIIRGVYNESRYDLGSVLAVDALGAIVLITVTVVGLAAAFYSVGYLQEEVRKGIIGFRRVKQYFALFHLFLMAMFLAVATVNPIFMWIAIEATTLATAFLISFYSKPQSMEAAWKYLILNSIGLLLGFFGTILFLSPTRNGPADKLVDWSTLLAQAPFSDPLVIKIAFIFVLIGYGTKVGFVPMHTWLPDAHSKAPSPISALLSGALLNVALLAILRFKGVADAILPHEFTQNLLIFFGMVSVVVSGFIMFAQQNYKRLFAYSSIEHMGIMAVGFGFGGMASFAALLHMIYHSLTKSMLFCAAGNLLLKFGSTKIVKVRGVLAALPFTGVILLTGFLMITGVPPFGTFVTEFYILSTGFGAHPVVVVTVLAMLVLVFIGFLRHVINMSFGRLTEPPTTGESSRLTTIPPLVLLSALAVTSIFLPPAFKSLLESAASFVP